MESPWQTYSPWGVEGVGGTLKQKDRFPPFLPWLLKARLSLLGPLSFSSLRSYPQHALSSSALPLPSSSLALLFRTTVVNKFCHSNLLTFLPFWRPRLLAPSLMLASSLVLDEHRARRTWSVSCSPLPLLELSLGHFMQDLAPLLLHAVQVLSLVTAFAACLLSLQVNIPPLQCVQYVVYSFPCPRSQLSSSLTSSTPMTSVQPVRSGLALSHSPPQLNSH